MVRACWCGMLPLFSAWPTASAQPQRNVSLSSGLPTPDGTYLSHSFTSQARDSQCRQEATMMTTPTPEAPRSPHWTFKGLPVPAGMDQGRWAERQRLQRHRPFITTRDEDRMAFTPVG